MSRIIIISAPSGVGKSTVIKELMRAFPNLVFSISATTRPIRQGEEHGKDYFFVSKEHFEQSISDNKFIEYATVYGNLYGTYYHTIKEQTSSNQWVLLDIDSEGLLNLKKELAHDPSLDIIDILLLPRSYDVLQERLQSRGTDTQEAIARRLKEAHLDIQKYQSYTYAIINDALEDCVRLCTHILRAHPHCNSPDLFQHKHAQKLLLP